MADRNPSFFGPVLPTADESIEAFSADELARIRARIIDRDVRRAHASASAWPAARRFETIYPAAPTPPDSRTLETPRVRRPDPSSSRIRIIDS